MNVMSVLYRELAFCVLKNNEVSLDTGERISKGASVTLSSSQQDALSVVSPSQKAQILAPYIISLIFS